MRILTAAFILAVPQAQLAETNVRAIGDTQVVAGELRAHRETVCDFRLAVVINDPI
jgi:hypothetical protein